jgi:hypothetical protein
VCEGALLLLRGRLAGGAAKRVRARPSDVPTKKTSIREDAAHAEPRVLAVTRVLHNPGGWMAGGQAGREPPRRGPFLVPWR